MLVCSGRATDHRSVHKLVHQGGGVPSMREQRERSASQGEREREDENMRMSTGDSSKNKALGLGSERVRQPGAEFPQPAMPPYVRSSCLS